MRTLLPSLISVALMTVPVLASGPDPDVGNFTLEDYFQGKTVARGVFSSKIGGSHREFNVFLHGEWDGTTLRLREDFVFADGEEDVKTWIFTKLPDGRYSGTREDVIGETIVTIKGNVARFNYDVLIPRTGKDPIKVHFRDKMILKPGGVVENRARVFKFGLPIAKVAVDFAQGTDISQVAMPEL